MAQFNYKRRYTRKMKREDIKEGVIIQHFKRTLMTEEEIEANPAAYLYRVLGIARHTETGADLVVYRHLGTDETWARPIESFLSQVDREKYPDARQKHRFKVFSETAETDEKKAFEG